MEQFPMPAGDFSLADLDERGFEGFVSIASASGAAVLPPRAPGVYAVVRESTGDPKFLVESPASWFKGKNPTVSIERLRAEWVPGVQTIYIGSGCNLRERVDLLIAFANAGRHQSVFHWGGRLLWQVHGAEDFLVGWRSDPFGVSSTERDLIDEFRDRYERMPFANLKRPPIRNCA